MRLVNLFGGLMAVLSIVGCERYKLDQKPEGLWRLDAGVKVYETVTLPSAEYAQLSKFAATKAREEYYGPRFRYVSKDETLVGTKNGPLHGQGRLTRTYEAVYRRSDDRLLGESVRYFRTGGENIVGSGPPSSAQCSQKIPDLGQSVLQKGE
jgi:hypothetical protein